jgi:hypothetical protein
MLDHPGPRTFHEHRLAEASAFLNVAMSRVGQHLEHCALPPVTASMPAHRTQPFDVKPPPVSSRG